MNAPRRPLNIAIATLGRFHVLDLARELDALGHHVRFYSYVPKRRAMKFGLPAHCHVSLLPVLAPLILLARLCNGTRLAPTTQTLLQRAADNLVRLRLKPCDVFIGMSGMYIKAPLAARRKFGARIVIERGSTHIETQKQILDAIKSLNPNAQTVAATDVVREMRSYEIADRVVVPSRHAETSFLRFGIAADRLFRNPYGVDLTMFNLDPAVKRDPHLVLFVGTWSYQKGVDVLTHAMVALCEDGFRLCHVGTVGDAPVPDAAWFHATGAVDQSELPAWYRRARCLVLPSRQDGFGLVLIQALACGCPIIGTTMTGAVDLADSFPDGKSVAVVSDCDVAGLADAIRRCSSGTASDADTVRRFHSDFSWRAYANRYAAMLEKLVHDAPDQTGTTERRTSRPHARRGKSTMRNS